MASSGVRRLQMAEATTKKKKKKKGLKAIKDRRTNKSGDYLKSIGL